MRILHYSINPLERVNSVEQKIKRWDKPNGLWVSVEGERDWAEWCRAEEWLDVDSQIVSEIILSPDANILYLMGESDLDQFTKDFSFFPFPDTLTILGIKWKEVASKYQGIIIAPYVYSRRLSGRASEWYYSWDCASGCIWDDRAVQSISQCIPKLSQQEAT